LAKLRLKIQIERIRESFATILMKSNVSSLVVKHNQRVKCESPRRGTAFRPLKGLIEDSY